MPTVFITGAAQPKNCGYAIARRFAAEGYHVAISSRRKADADAAATRLAAQYGVQTKGCQLDLCSVADIRRVFAELKASFGGVDVFVGNSASLGMGQSAMDLTEEDFDGVMDVNIKGNFFCSQEAARQMREKKHGAIVLIGSVHYRGAVFGRSLYATSKGAITSLVHNLAVEFAADGIRVNQVVPGAIRTDRWDDLSPEEIARRRRNWPTGMESTGADIAAGVYYLASDEAHTITGTELVIDSGVLACLLAYNGGSH